MEMMQVAPAASSKQVCFTIARCVLAHSFDYDAGVLTCSSLLPHARHVEDVVLKIAAATIDMRPEELTAEQQI